ncbi:MAG: hypothetical protein AB7G23_02495 [Vicinamibacterales bacterium]
MYQRELRNAAHTWRFTIRQADAVGWEIREERDSQVVRQVVYDDWHRVERARMAFAVEAAVLQETGWTES